MANKLSDERIGLTAEDRLRLHVHDPDTFTFDFDDAEKLVSEIDALRAAQANAEPVAWLPDDDNDLAQMVEDFHSGSVAFANEPDEFDHLIELTPSRLRKFIASLPPAPSQVTEEMVGEVHALEEACNQARLALAGVVNAQSALDKLDCRPAGVSAALTAALGAKPEVKP